jgi:gas vesicle protein
MNTGKTMLAVLASLAAGAAIGVLFAPDKGSDTRKKISKKGENLADALGDKIDEKFDDLLTAITGKAKKTAKQENPVVSKE